MGEEESEQGRGHRHMHCLAGPWTGGERGGVGGVAFHSLCDVQGCSLVLAWHMGSPEQIRAAENML